MREDEEFHIEDQPMQDLLEEICQDNIFRKEFGRKLITKDSMISQIYREIEEHEIISVITEVHHIKDLVLQTIARGDITIGGLEADVPPHLITILEIMEEFLTLQRERDKHILHHNMITLQTGLN